MEIDILKKAGLTESQAKGYMALIENGEKSPAELSELISETRTNTYAIVDKLEKLGLAKKKDNANKAIYIAAHPSAIETLAEKRRKIVTRNEQEIVRNLSTLIDIYYEHNESPGIRTLQGVDGIKKAYKDILNENKDNYLLRTTADTPSLGDEFMQDFIKKRVQLGINTYALTHDTEIARQHIRDNKDEEWLFDRHTLPNNTYTAPVEINVYGDKVALIAFGETQMATIINSPAIAEAMKQVLMLVGDLIGKNDPTKKSNLLNS